MFIGEIAGYGLAGLIAVWAVWYAFQQVEQHGKDDAAKLKDMLKDSGENADAQANPIGTAADANELLRKLKSKR